MADAPNGNGKWRQLRWYVFTILVAVVGLLLIRWANHVDQAMEHQAEMEVTVLTGLATLTARIEALRDLLLQVPKPQPTPAEAEKDEEH